MHISPFHVTKPWIPCLISNSTSHLHVGNGISPTVRCPWAGDTMADAVGVTAQPCWVALPLVEVRPSLFGWPCLPGYTALPHAAFKMLSACQAALPEPQLVLTAALPHQGRWDQGPGRAGHLATLPHHLCSLSSMEHQLHESTSNWFPAHVCVAPHNTIKTKASSL